MSNKRDQSEREELRISQNFFKSRHLIARLLDRTSITKEDTVVEIGPGKGIITEELARRCKTVVAVEKDERLYHELRIRFANTPNVHLHLGDALEFSLPHSPYKVFANIPFNIAADLVRKLIEAPVPPDDAYLVMQRAAAERFAGIPFGKESQVSVLTKPFFELTFMHEFRRTDFTPVPRVNIVLLRIQKRLRPLISPGSRQIYRDFVVYAFNRWKPTVREALSELIRVDRFMQLAKELGFDPAARPSELRVEDWIGLFDRAVLRSGDRGKRIIAGSERRLRKQQAGLQKIHRTRTAPGWNKRDRR